MSTKIAIYKGDYAKLDMQLSERGIDADLTDATVSLTLKKTSSSPVALTKSWTYHYSPLTGQTRIDLEMGDTDISPAIYKFDIQAAWPGDLGKIHTYILGDFEIVLIDDNFPAYIIRGDDAEFDTFIVNATDGTNVPLTGYSLKFRATLDGLNEDATDGDGNYLANCWVDLDTITFRESDGALVFYIPHNQTALLKKQKYVYSIRVFAQNGNQRTWTRSYLTVDPDITINE